MMRIALWAAAIGFGTALAAGSCGGDDDSSPPEEFTCQALCDDGTGSLFGGDSDTFDAADLDEAQSFCEVEQMQHETLCPEGSTFDSCSCEEP